MNQKISVQQQAILNRIQANFPITAAPYRMMALELGIPEQTLYKKTRELKQRKIIRRLGAIFDTPKLGFVSALIGLKVKKRYLVSVGNAIAKYSMVTHCYARNHEINLWFTLTGKSQKELNSNLSKIAKLNGIQEILFLPATKTFKIRAEFRLNCLPRVKQPYA
ncbi:MAG: Lrp/AsnC family transcriptional regulator [bacterium]|nr:Lrp/AsnC family transcriptional regulator [bacterium]